MTRLLAPALMAIAAASLLTGCLNIQTGGSAAKPTVGQQLIDLQSAKAMGAISEAEYQAQKARILGDK